MTKKQTIKLLKKYGQVPVVFTGQHTQTTLQSGEEYHFNYGMTGILEQYPDMIVFTPDGLLSEEWSCFPWTEFKYLYTSLN